MADELEITEALSDRTPLAKAHFIGREDVPGSNVKPPETQQKDEEIFEKAGALSPPYGPDILCKLFEHSNSLRQNVDAYSVNIDGFGHRFEPVIDLEADDAFDQVRDAMFLETLHETEAEGGEASDVEFPADEEVDARIETMTDEMRLEKAKLDAFFEFCCLDESFVSLRTKTRQDKEIIGTGYWEVLRNAGGEFVQFTYAPSFTMRMMKLDPTPIEIEMKVKRSPLTFDTIKVRRRFRRFVQIFEGTKVFFKELGDPRIVSALTGRTYKTDQDLQREEGQGPGGGGGPFRSNANDTDNVPSATEILHFPIHSPHSPYGIPRWIGTLLAVLGSRQSEEVNFLYFENKSVPPLAVLVSGGRLSSGSVAKLESFVENRIKGRSNFHNILVIEAESAENAPLEGSATGRMRIEIVPLNMAQHNDGLFQEYDERNIDKVGMSFRLPRLLRGDIRDFNRATAEAALEFAETQVFSPEREAFDWMINRKILSELEIKFWTFESNAPTTRNPVDLADIIEKLVVASILTPEEARELAKGIFNRDFKKIDEIWTKIPPDLLKAGILPADADLGDLLEELPEGQPGQPGEPPEPVVAGDLSADDLRAKGGAKVPAQGKVKGKRKERKGFVRFPSSIGKRYNAATRSERIRKLARELLELRQALDSEERRLAKERFFEGDPDREVIKVPADELAELFDEDTDAAE